MNIPRAEHPRPQFMRKDWINLNGTWTFTFDHGESGREQGLFKSTGFDRNINVPFCPESKLSGVGHTDFIKAMWYHRRIDIPEAWNGRRILLHFGAVDYQCEAFIDGKGVGTHTGGTSSFTFDITGLAAAGTHELVVAVRDDIRSYTQASGKQSDKFGSYGCLYTRTTGIWQTVWLEAAAMHGLSRVRTITDIGSVTFTPEYHALGTGTLTVTIRDGKDTIAETTVPCAGGIPVTLPIPKPKLWSPISPHLYSITFTVSENDVLDSVESYFGMRKIQCRGNMVYLNDEPLFQRLVLDQGFYPDGLWTAPSDAALKQDIELSIAAGFNGARLHQKVFEERFHFWADTLGYLTWGESSSWGLDAAKPDAQYNFMNEWKEILLRDMNHPSIITWTPFNETVTKETHGRYSAKLQRDIYDLTHMIDPTRPVNDASGYVHAKTDLWTVHNYTQDGAKLAVELTPKNGSPWRNFPDKEIPYGGQPYLVDEYGGIKWIADETQRFSEKSWGYGDAPKTLDEFYARLEGQIDALLSHGHIAGYCYTQLTDVEQEQNGIYNYDRTVKFDMKRIRKAFSRTR